RGRTTNDHVIEFLEQCAETRESIVNTSLNSVQGHAWSRWYGNILVMSKATTEWDPPRYADISLVDYRDAVDYLHYYREGEGSATDGIGASDGVKFHHIIMDAYSGKVKAVRINCTGDVNRGLPEITQVEIPKLHPA